MTREEDYEELALDRADERGLAHMARMDNRYGLVAWYRPSPSVRALLTEPETREVEG